MRIGNLDVNIDKTMMPSYLPGDDYPTRQYSFMQDTLNNALSKSMQMQNPQNGISIQQQSAQQPSTWQGQNK